MTQRSRLVLPTGINDPGATWQPHAPPRPGLWSRLVVSTGTVESLVPVGATNRDQWPFLYTRPFLLPPLTPPYLLTISRGIVLTPAGCPNSGRVLQTHRRLLHPPVPPVEQRSPRAAAIVKVFAAVCRELRQGIHPSP